MIIDMGKKSIRIVVSDENYSIELANFLNNKNEFSAKRCTLDQLGDINIEDIVIFDAHFRDTTPADCDALKYVKQLRINNGMRNPFIVLSFFDKDYLLYLHEQGLKNNVFLGHYYKKSTRVLQLPISSKLLIKTIEEIHHCSDEELQFGIDYYNKISNN